MSPKNEQEKLEMMKIPYRECIGSLLFAAQISRPDISFAVNMLSRYVENPGKSHWQALKRIFRYLKATKDLRLSYGETNERLIGYCDADWGGDMDERTWCTKRQPTVALSSTEAEFMSMTAAIQEAKWLKQIMQELNIDLENHVTINCDNKGAIELAKNNTYSPRSKHIDIKNKFEANIFFFNNFIFFIAQKHTYDLI